MQLNVCENKKLFKINKYRKQKHKERYSNK